MKLMPKSVERPIVRNHGSRGQSLVETALMMPLLLIVVLNAVNLAYFFLMAVNLTGAARSATLYSIEGSYTPYASTEPSSGSSNCSTSPNTVACLVLQDLTGAVPNPNAVTVQVCSQINTNPGTNSGLHASGTSQASNCVSCTNGTGCSAANSYIGTPAASVDPEQPTAPFILNQITISYRFNSLIPGTFFNAAMRSIPGCTGSSCLFVRTAYMRSAGP
jgi:Flp pilus assembly protein TadG